MTARVVPPIFLAVYDLVDDTIVAISTAAGKAARGIVRVSGANAVPIAEKIFSVRGGRSVGAVGGHRRVSGWLEIEPGCPGVPAAVYVFRAPRSYTRQDLVEFHMPGSPAIASMLLDRLLSEGARAALPGEFTARAFVSGRMDLTEAEGVASVIGARTDAQLAAANRVSGGAISRWVEGLQERLTDLLSLVEADIDFSEEGVEFISAGELAKRVWELRGDLAGLVRSSISAEQLNVLPSVVLVGPPNAGKSSLLNALTGVDRAICSPLPGTTRDMLSAPLELRRSEALLVDVAGLAEPVSSLDKQAHELARRVASEADVLVFVIDVSEDPVEPRFELLDLPAGADDRMIVAANKVDLLHRVEESVRCEQLREMSGEVIWPVSARTGTGLDDLRGAIESRLDRPSVDRGRELLALNARHRRAIAEADEALERATHTCEAQPDLLQVVELLACDLREASDQLGLITGAVHAEDVLSRIFGRFCIGK